MTLVMIWQESSPAGYIWVASDSRLSGGNTVGSVRLTDRATKILEIPVILRRQTALSVLGTPVKITNLGFVFTGSSLVALQAYAAVLPLWSRLQSSGPEVLPSVRDFANHLAYFMQAFAGEIAFSQQGNIPKCQCALIGWSEPLTKLDGYLIEIEPTITPISTTVSQLEIFNSGSVQILGSGSNKARQELATILGADGEAQLRREPLKLIRQFINTSQHDEVGGGVQIGCANPDGFQLFFDVQPVVYGTPFPDMRYHGFKFGEISRIGNVFVNLPGLT